MSQLPDSLATFSVFGVSVAAALGSGFKGFGQDLDVVELWSGVQSVCNSAQARGLSAEPFDYHRLPGTTDKDDGASCEDILQPAGFQKALQLVLRLKRGGLLWMAPVCSSWNRFLNAARTRRCQSNEYIGDVSYEPVRQGNMMANVAFFFLLVAWAREIHAVIENPSNSLMWTYFELHCPMSEVITYSAICPRCVFDTVPFGKRVLKKFRFLATASWVSALQLPCRCPKGLHKPLVRKRMVNGVPKRSGVPKDMKASGAYPLPMGRAIIDAWLGKPGVHGRRSDIDDAKGRIGAPSSTAKSVVQGSRSGSSGSSLTRWRNPRVNSEEEPPPVRTRTLWMHPALDGDDEAVEPSAAPCRGWQMPDLD